MIQMPNTIVIKYKYKPSSVWSYLVVPKDKLEETLEYLKHPTLVWSQVSDNGSAIYLDTPMITDFVTESIMYNQ